jgi:hypothetical protein
MSVRESADGHRTRPRRGRGRSPTVIYGGDAVVGADDERRGAARHSFEHVYE